MKLYFHHVGETGANRDFPKTVYNKRDVSLVSKHVPDSLPQKQFIVGQLDRHFPDGKFNCWGVPSGASKIIRNLRVGDSVLLVKTIRLGGEVSTLCEVKVYCPVELHDLSFELWGEHRFPYVFFFNSITLEMSWEKLKEELGYKENYDPSGKFYPVADGKPHNFKSHQDYVAYIKKTYT
jgi:hypothetical protein